MEDLCQDTDNGVKAGFRYPQWCRRTILKAPHVDDVIAERASHLLAKLWRSEYGSAEDLEYALFAYSELIGGAEGAGLQNLSDALLRVMEIPRNVKVSGVSRDLCYLSWQAAARYSNKIPDPAIPGLREILKAQFRGMPPVAIGAVARLAGEAVMRGGSLEEVQPVISLLWATRANASRFPRYCSYGFLGFAGALRESNSIEIPQSMLDVITDWMPEAAVTADVEVRRAVASAAGLLMRRVTGLARSDIEPTIKRLREDPFLSVRKALEDPKTVGLP